MTNEEAIKVFDELKKSVKNQPSYIYEALDVAYEALKDKGYKDGWTPIVTRPLTEKEKEEYPDATFIYDCHMPDDGEEVLVSTIWGVCIDTYCAEPEGCYFENYCDEGDVLAWQPKPKPYKKGTTKND